MSKMITQGEAAIVLGVTAQAVCWMSERGKIKAYGRPRRYKYSDVVALAAYRAAHPTRAGRPSSATLLARRSLVTA